MHRPKKSIDMRAAMFKSYIETTVYSLPESFCIPFNKAQHYYVHKPEQTLHRLKHLLLSEKNPYLQRVLLLAIGKTLADSAYTPEQRSLTPTGHSDEDIVNIVMAEPKLPAVAKIEYDEAVDRAYTEAYPYLSTISNLAIPPANEFAAILPPLQAIIPGKNLYTMPLVQAFIENICASNCYSVVRQDSHNWFINDYLYWKAQALH